MRGRVVAANGTVIPIAGKATVQIQMGNITLPVEVMVSDRVTEGIQSHRR